MRLLVATVLKQARQMDAVLQHFLKEPTLKPATLINIFRLGMAQFETALANPLYQSPSKAKLNAGNCAMKMKNLPLAERYLLDALRFEPDLPVLQADLARVYYERRDFQRAGFFVNRLTTVAKPETMPAEWLWLAIRVQRKLGEQATEQSLGTQLRRRHPSSPEFAAYQRGAFDE